MNFLVSFSPIISHRAGRDAVEQFGLPPFIDGSCRREPDFEATRPSISSLCRSDKFVPRLSVGDSVVYITRKGKYLDERSRHWRLVAVLEIAKRFDSHGAAADWYRGKGLELPSNCLVDGNPPKPLHLTHQHCPKPIRDRRGKLSAERIIHLWDAGYQNRARKCGVFVIAKPRFIELFSPIALFDDDMNHVFGRIPGTQNPPAIAPKEFKKLSKYFPG